MNTKAPTLTWTNYVSDGVIFHKILTSDGDNYSIVKNGDEIFCHVPPYLTKTADYKPTDVDSLEEGFRIIADTIFNKTTNG